MLHWGSSLDVGGSPIFGHCIFIWFGFVCWILEASVAGSPLLFSCPHKVLQCRTDLPSCWPLRTDVILLV